MRCFGNCFKWLCGVKHFVNRDATKLIILSQYTYIYVCVRVAGERYDDDDDLRVMSA